MTERDNSKAPQVRPSIFVGSSTEGLEFARAVRALLALDAELTLWNEGFFGVGSTFIETLMAALPRFDFAVLLLTPDDLVTSREVFEFGPRDNVLFELGLFMGRLGRSRTFLVHQTNMPLKIPSDLAGVIAAGYDWPRHDLNHQAALGPACDSIRKAVRDLGPSETKLAAVVRDVQMQQVQQQARLTAHETELRALRVAFGGIVTQHEFDKLVGLSRDAEFRCYYSEMMADELRRLRAMGLATNHPGTGLAALRYEQSRSGGEFDLKRYFKLTEQGREYLELRNELNQNY